jgi:ATP-dependent Lon protease
MYFDELDKISESLKGQELAGTQTHLTDVAQNDTFQDRY